MLRSRQFFFASALLAVVSWCGVALGATVTGTVTNGTGKSGRIYLTVFSAAENVNVGTSLAAAGPFSISGVPAGTECTVRAFVDTDGTGIQHANDPRGSSASFTVPASGSVSAGSFAVATPAAVPPQAPPATVYGGGGVNFVKWQGALDPGGLPVADRYTVSWSTSPTGTPVAGSREVWSGHDDSFVHRGASTLYYRITASSGSATAPSGWNQAVPPSGTGSVTGRVFFPGTASAGPLYVMLANELVNPPVVRVAAVPTPASGAAYTVANVPAGRYVVSAFLDLNDDGSYDVGDIGLPDRNDYHPTVTVATGSATAPDLTLVDADGSTVLTVGHGKSDVWEWYNLVFAAQSMKKQLTRVRVVSGPQLTEPIDVAVNGIKFRTRHGAGRPAVGDTYQMELTYADGSTETVARAVTGVLDGFATPTAPVGTVTYSATPTFAWSAPSPAPAQPYIYSIWMSRSSDGANIWTAWGLPSTQTSLVYGAQGSAALPTVTDGTGYKWIVDLTDANGNMAAREVTFTATSAPALTGFSPAGGLPGTAVTIAGINFPAGPGSSTVLFNATPAQVTAATPTSLTVAVPAGATTGTIKVTIGGQTLVSARSFFVAAPATVRGRVATSSETAIAGARVEAAEDPALFTQTAADGSYTLQPVFPGQTVTLKIAAAGYAPTYSNPYQITGSLNLTPYPNHLYTPAQLAAWGVLPGRGAIVGKVLNTATTTFSPVPAATVSIVGTLAGSYPVTYLNGSALGGSSTYANGMFLIPNVRAFDYLEATAAKSAWSFWPTGFGIRADSVSEGAVLGSTMPPSIATFSPKSGGAGTAVVIAGTNFSATAAENTVRFNGTQAQVTAATPTSLTATVPAAATTGTVTVTTAGITATSSENFTRRYTLTAQVTGSGTVTSVPVGISCRSANCSAPFDQGTLVELIATADAGGSLASWGGGCSGSGTCNVTMSADRTVSAAFGLSGMFRIGATYFGTLQAAFDAAAGGETIEARAMTFTQASWNFSRAGVAATLAGGYDASFLGNAGGATVLQGRLNCLAGTLRVDKVRVR